jgi:hypothetical protein
VDAVSRCFPVLTGWLGGPKRRRCLFVCDDRHVHSAVRAFKPDGGPVFFPGEAIYRGRDIGTVEAALASGLATARAVLAE